MVNERYTFPCTCTHPVVVISGEDVEKVVTLRISVALLSMLTFPSTCKGLTMVKFFVCVTFRSPMMVARVVGGGDIEEEGDGEGAEVEEEGTDVLFAATNTGS